MLLYKPSLLEPELKAGKVELSEVSGVYVPLRELKT